MRAVACLSEQPQIFGRIFVLRVHCGEIASVGASVEP
jgi:hypothetical protein